LEKQQSHTISETKLREELNRFLSLIKTSQYRDAHEALEESWKENRDSDIGHFLKGLINGGN